MLSKLTTFLNCQLAIDEEDVEAREAAISAIVAMQHRLKRLSVSSLQLETKVSEFESMNNLQARVQTLLDQELAPLVDLMSALLNEVPFPKQCEALLKCAEEISQRAARVVDLLFELSSTAPSMLGSNDRWIRGLIDDAYVKLESVSQGWSTLACGFLDPVLERKVVDTDPTAAKNKNNKLLISATNPLHPASLVVRQQLYEQSDWTVAQIEGALTIGLGDEAEDDDKRSETTQGDSISVVSRKGSFQEGLTGTPSTPHFTQLLPPQHSTTRSGASQQLSLTSVNKLKHLHLEVITVAEFIKRLVVEYRCGPALVAMKIKGAASESVGQQLCLSARYVLKCTGSEHDADWGFSMPYVN